MYGKKMSVPTLYSLQHCPYAMRARLALLMSKQNVLIRAVVTKSKPKEMIDLSPKGTIPVLLLSNGQVIDESLDIMIWALQKNDPFDLLLKNQPQLFKEMLELIKNCDNEFRTSLSAYKNAKRFHRPEEMQLRQQCEIFIQEIEFRLQKNSFIISEKLSLVDLALLPFIRQFVNVDKKWFRHSPYPLLTKWLINQLQNILFTKAMKKYSLWEDSHKEFLLSWD